MSVVGLQMCCPRSWTQRVSSGQSLLLVQVPPTAAFVVACAVDGGCGGGELGAFRLQLAASTKMKAAMYRMP
jgi:hypothetical protein